MDLDFGLPPLASRCLDHDVYPSAWTTGCGLKLHLTWTWILAMTSRSTPLYLPRSAPPPSPHLTSPHSASPKVQVPLAKHTCMPCTSASGSTCSSLALEVSLPIKKEIKRKARHVACRHRLMRCDMIVGGRGSVLCAVGLGRLAYWAGAGWRNDVGCVGWGTAYQCGVGVGGATCYAVLRRRKRKELGLRSLHLHHLRRVLPRLPSDVRHIRTGLDGWLDGEAHDPAASRCGVSIARESVSGAWDGFLSGQPD